MKNLSRVEISRLIQKEAFRIIVGTALLFVLAGSIWTHLGLGPVVLELPLIGAWFLIHVSGWLAMRSERLAPLAILAGLCGLQFYFHLILRVYEAPFLPLAPVFFVVSALSIAAYTQRRIWVTLFFWTLAWGSSYFWLSSVSPEPEKTRKAVVFAFGLNGLFLGVFWATGTFFARRLAEHVSLLGPRQDFDTQRLQAAKLQVLGELTSSLTHEIANPLTAIAGYNYQIREELKDNPVAPSVEILSTASDRVKFNIDRITEITRTVRSFSRDSSLEELKPVCVREIIADTMILMRHHLKSSGIEVKVEYAPEDLWVMGNFVQIGQVVVNLLSNAKDACKETERKKVTVGYAREAGTEDQVRIWVEDTGHGIAPAQSGRVFQPFFTTKGHGQGTGLGLYISRLIVERLKGQIDWECPRDSTGRVLGTRFWMSFQRSEAVAPDTDNQSAA